MKCIDKSLSAQLLRKSINETEVRSCCNIELVLQTPELGEQILSVLKE